MIPAGGAHHELMLSDTEWYREDAQVPVSS